MSVFDVLREQVAIEHIVATNHGDKLRCVAPSHEDANPSMHLCGDHVHCFSCGFHGDVVDVWAALRGFVRPVEAALDLAREFGIELPEVSSEARQKAQERRETEDRYLLQAQACHKALHRHAHVAQWWETRGFGHELCERFLLGANKGGKAAVVPFWHRGRVQGLIRRPLDGKPDKYLYPKTEEFAGGYRPLFIPGSVHAGACLVEGIVDALAIAALEESAIGVGGTGISREQMRELNKLPSPLYVLPDADEEGEEAARKWTRELYPKAFLCRAEYEEEATHA